MSQMSKSDTERAFRMAHSNIDESLRYCRELLDAEAITQAQFDSVFFVADLVNLRIIDARNQWRRSAAVPNTDWDVP